MLSLLLLASHCSRSWLAFRLPRLSSARGHVAAHTEGETASLAGQGKEALLAAIKHFQEVKAKVGTARVDFGVRGGELDKKSRAPKNLAADGAFYRVSNELGIAADRVLELVNVIAATNPNPAPLRGFGTAAGANSPLNGTWRLLFTTAADATFSQNTSRGDAKVSNVVDAAQGTVTNCIDFVPKAGQTDLPVEWLRVSLSAVAETESRLALTFRYVRARISRFFGLPLFGRKITLTFPVPGPFITRIITLFTGKKPPKPYFDVLFLDESLRVHRTGEGNIFIQEKVL